MVFVGRESLQETLKNLPDKPGVYMMKDEAGRVIYVGKASVLKNRVRSYFQKGAVSPKTRILAGKIADIEYIVTSNDVEALILESNLIKEKSPRYNVRLKDDKHYPYLKVTDERFPRVTVVRRREKGGRTFGPYTDSAAVRTTMRFLRKLFPIRTCNLDLSGELNYRPCLLYHIGRCGAPCAGLQTEEEYNKLIEEVCLFLEGRHEKLIPALRDKMQAAAKNLEFEKAARLRDQVRALERMVEKQKVLSVDKEDLDVIGLAVEGAAVCVQVYFVRDGKLVGREHFFLDRTADEETGELLTAFVEQYYARASFIPRLVLLPVPVDEQEVVEAWLAEQRGGRVELRVPQRGEKRRMVEMAQENARLVLEEHLSRETRRAEANRIGLEQLQEVLDLPHLPERIEAYDISNFHGAESVAAMVVLEDGVPAPDEYRRFKLRTQGPDDYAMMQEVLRRRFTRALKEQEELDALPPEEQEKAMAEMRFVKMPDLILIDGGKGQLNAARDVLRELGLEDIPTISLAERLEEVFVEGRPEPILFGRDTPALHILQRVRDEAHRFGLSYHRKLRDKRTTRSALDDIPGIGPKRKRALLRKFGSVKGVAQASLEELQTVPGISRELAERIREQLG